MTHFFLDRSQFVYDSNFFFSLSLSLFSNAFCSPNFTIPETRYDKNEWYQLVIVTKNSAYTKEHAAHSNPIKTNVHSIEDTLANIHVICADKRKTQALNNAHSENK